MLIRIKDGLKQKSFNMKFVISTDNIFICIMVLMLFKIILSLSQRNLR